MKRLSAFFAILLLFIGCAEARFPRGGSSAAPFTFNGSKLQTNFNGVDAGDYAFLNVLKASTFWSIGSNVNAPVTPDLLDSDGYLNSTSLNGVGVTALTFVPTQNYKSGPYIYKWDGDGTVGSGGTTGSAVAYTISSATQAGTVVTLNLSSAPDAMKAGQPITVAGFTSNWNGLNNTWRVQDVNTSCSNCFRVDTGVSYTGGATSSSPTATFTTSTTVANVGGNLNGSGRFAFQPSASFGFNTQQYSLNTAVTSVQSSVNYPHNIRVVLLSDEAALDAGGIFQSKFLATAAKFGSLRFLNWQYGIQRNISNVTTWATRTPTTYFQYSGDQRRSDLYAGATTISGRTYSTSAPAINSATGAAWAGLTDKSTVHALISQGQATFVATFASGNANITITGHTYAVGDRVNFNVSGGATLPSNISAGNYYTLLSVAANTVQLDNGSGVAIVPNANSTGTINSILAWSTYVSTFAGGGAANIAIPNHHYSVGDFVAFLNFGGTIPAAYNFQQYYYVCSVVAGVSIQVAPTSTCGGTILTQATAGTGTVVSSGKILLNVGGTGAKEVRSAFGGIFTGNVWPDAGNFESLATFVYDATLQQWWMFGGNIDFGSLGIASIVPYEVQLELARQVGAHPYWVTPVWAADPMTDFMPSLMQMVKTSGLQSAGMIPRFEPPNELWNTQFPQTQYATAKAASYGWAFGYNDWYGKVLASLGQSAALIYGIGNLGTTYHLYGAVQTTLNVTGDVGNAFPRFAANSYVGTTPQSPLTGSWGTITFTAVPPSPNATTGPSATQYVSHLANAQYYLSNATQVATGTQTLASLSSAWDGTQFTATFAGTTMTEVAVNHGSALAIGKTISCPGVTPGTTITGGSTGAGWTISSNPGTISYSQGCTAGVDTTAPTKLADSVVDTVVNAAITGCPGACNLHVNSITSGNTIGAFLQIYGGTVAFASGINITGGSFPDYSLSGNPGNQAATSFSIGSTISLTGIGLAYQLWANFANANFGLTKIAGYEGNYSNDYVNGAWSDNLLKYASKQTSNMQTYATTNWNNFRGTTGAVGQFPSVYNMTGNAVIGDAWSVLDDIYQSPTSPQFNAVSAY